MNTNNEPATAETYKITIPAGQLEAILAALRAAGLIAEEHEGEIMVWKK